MIYNLFRNNTNNKTKEVYYQKKKTKSLCNNSLTSMKKEKTKVCIITTPRIKASLTPLSNLVNIISSLSADVFLITGNEGVEILKINKNISGISISHSVNENLLYRILNYIFLQLKISYEVIKLNKNIDLFVFFMGEGLLLPVITLKLLRKPIILNLAASSPKILNSHKDLQFILKLPKYLEIINYILSDKIVIYSPNLITEWNLSKYKNKILIGHEHIIDLKQFKLEKNYNGREPVIGYIGRLSEEKGVTNFIESIPLILKEKTSLNILIIGEGDLKNIIEMYLLRNCLKNYVKLVGWISHEQLPKYLNSLKLLVLPSYTEGLPNIMLESMACGTPVLATKVGAIPDIIKDMETGFILEDNSPDCIAKNVIRALEFPEMEKIVQNARAIIETDFTYEGTIERYPPIF